MKTRLGILAFVGLLLAFLMKPLSSPVEGQGDLERQVDETIREYGTAESAKSIDVVSELTGESTIVSIVRNGEEVKKGDLLVTLDDSKLRETHVEAQLELQAARIAVAAANQRITSQKAAALQFQQFQQLNLKAAELDRKKHAGDEGAFAVSLRDLKRKVELLESRKKHIAAMIAKTKQGSTREELEFESEKADVQLAGIRDQIQLLTTLEHPHQTALLELAVVKAKGELLKQSQESAASIEKAELALQAAKLVETQAESKLKRVESQLAKCRIKAPSDGIVMYSNEANRRSSTVITIEEGATVKERQKILSVVDMTQLQVRVEVHESRIHRVKKGQSARIEFDALPNRTFGGKVLSISKTPEPASWFSSSVKTYAVTVSLDGPVDKLKLGLSALVEIDAEAK